MDKNIDTPKVTVLMPVYNGEKYMRKAIDSILNQTFTDFEFLIINDGSTDSSKEIVKSYTDPRIRLINNGGNIKLIKTLNKGLDLAKGKYIARMDADDISSPKRLAIQVKFMDKHLEIGIAGTWAEIIPKNHKKYIKPISDSKKFKTTLLFKCPMIHPSVIIRKKTLKKYNLQYSQNSKHAEDYDLWSRAVEHFPITNIKKILLQYRIHDNNISKTQSVTQKRNSKKIKIRQLWKNIKILSSKEEILIHESISKPPQYKINDFLKKEKAWFSKLTEQNKNTNFYDEPEFSQVLSQRWLQICSVNSSHNWKIWKIFWRSPLRKKLDFKEWQNYKLLIRFFIKCLLKKHQKETF